MGLDWRRLGEVHSVLAEVPEQLQAYFGRFPTLFIVRSISFPRVTLKRCHNVSLQPGHDRIINFSPCHAGAFHGIFTGGQDLFLEFGVLNKTAGYRLFGDPKLFGGLSLVAAMLQDSFGKFVGRGNGHNEKY